MPPAPSRALTVCRVCESACGLLAEVESGAVVGLGPDPGHPVSRGYACAKGLGFLGVHNHPQRLLRPALRRAGGLQTVSWEEALGEAGRLGDILREHGPDAVGLYVGNAASQSFGAVLGVTALQRALGTRKLYTALTVDNAPMFVVLEACLGNAMCSMVADYAASDLVVLFGTDPLSSQPSQAQSHPEGVRDLLRRAARGELVVVDPRPSMTARKADLHLAPRPGSDLALLAWLCARAVARRPGGEGAPSPRPPGALPASSAATTPDLLDPAELPGLRAALAPWTLERACAATGLGPEPLRALDRRLAGASRPLVWSGLGVLLGPQGTLGWWLTLVLQTLLGGLDAPGGWRFQPGAVDVPALWKLVGPPGWDRANPSPVGGIPAVLGTYAAATMADDILAPRPLPPSPVRAAPRPRSRHSPEPQPLRALVVVGGNPAESLPDPARVQEALRHLDLLVVADLLPTATSALAHVVLPAADWLERPESGLLGAHLRPRPHLQLVERVVRPAGEARTDWEILSGLARAAGRPRFGSWLAEGLLRSLDWGPEELARLVVTARSPLSWRLLAAAPRGLELPVEAATAGTRRLAGRLPGGRARLLVPELVEALARLCTAAGAEPAALRLLSSVRPPGQMNSWIGTERARPVAISPADAAAAGLRDGSAARIRRVGGPDWVEVRIAVDPGLGPGTVVFAYAGSPNVNQLIARDVLEPFSGQPMSNGTAVEIEALPG